MMAPANFKPDQVTIRMAVYSDVEAAVQCFDDHFDVFEAPATVVAFLCTYPESFFVATTIDDGAVERVIGVCSSPIGPQDTAFFGLYGLRAGYRSFGIGSRLFQRCLDYIGPQRNAGLYAVPEMKQKYMERGFTTREGISMVNYVGVPSGQSHMKKLKAVTEESAFDAKFLCLDNADELLLQQIIDYDYGIHSESREQLLRNAIVSQGYLTCAVFSSGKIRGYGCYREHSLSGRQLLGPLYADSPEVAIAVSAHLLCALPVEKIAKGVILNALDSQPESLRLATEWLGIEEIERCERLFRGTPIKANFELIYGVFSMDFSL